jgi:uncharacterized membrane protein
LLKVKGEAATGTEPYWSRKIAPGIYNVNWIEADGMTASQVLNFNAQEVTVFLTWNEAGQRGDRDSASLHSSFSLS